LTRLKILRRKLKQPKVAYRVIAKHNQTMAEANYTNFMGVRPQPGVEHGPYLPLDEISDQLADYNLRLESLHQLDEHSRALGRAWASHKISFEEAKIIDDGIKTEIGSLNKS
jgi:hypothetical protein